jgi:Na+-translocating ferredoxin:NAD+ oxidoreductase RnfC subunit
MNKSSDLSRRAFSAIALAAAAVLPLAQAQTLNVTRKVNRDELRECLDAGDSLKVRNDDLKARSTRLNAVNEELKAEAQDISQQIEKQERTPTTFSLGRERLERRKAAYEQKAATAKSESEKFIPEADTLSKDVETYNRRCGGITYSREDREAILKERETGRK